MIPPNDNVSVEELEKIEEMEGKLGSSDKDDKLMKSVMENDQNQIDDGKLITESINNATGAFNPDLMFENLVKNYQLTKKIYGERLIREVSGYDEDYVERNRKIPEFQKEMKKNIKSKIKDLKNKGLIDKEGSITKKGFELSAIAMYLEELENLKSHGIQGEKLNKKTFAYGERGPISKFNKGSRYRDINSRASIKLAARRGHSKLLIEDLKVNERKAKGRIEIIYALDASASMRGDKIAMAKKAGVALAYKAIEEMNKVGIIVFGDEIKEETRPTLDFAQLIFNINKIRASNQTNISKTIQRAYDLFGSEDNTKHLMLITDALPTEGEDPNKETLEAASRASLAGITISVIGIALDKEGKKLAEKIVETGNGRLYITKETKELDMIVLQDYFEEGS